MRFYPPGLRIVLRGLRVLGLLLGLTQVSAGAAVITLGDEPRVDIARQAMIFVDDSSTLEVAAVASLREAFRPVVPKDLDRHYDSRVFWLRATLRNSNAQPIERWLAVGHPRLEAVTLYAAGPGGWAGIESGLRVPVRDKPVTSGVAFPLRLEPGEQREIILRITSRTVIDLNATLWKPIAFVQSHEDRRLLIAAGFGGSMVIAFISLFVFVRLRDPGYLYFFLLHLCGGFMEFGREGLWERYLWPAHLAMPLLAHALVSVGALLCMLFIQRSFLDLEKVYPRWNRTFLAIALLLVLFIPVAALRYGLWIHTMSTILAPIYLLALVNAFVAWRRGNNVGGYLVLAWGVVWIVEGLREISHLGLVSWPWAQALSVTWALLLSSPLFFLALVEKSRTLRIELHETQQLARAKSDFMARVSHELRAPLNTIIGYASMLGRGATSLSLAEGTADIQRAGSHLLVMIDDLLEQSRLDAGRVTLRMEPLALQPWLDEIERSGSVSAQEHGNVFSLVRSASLPAGVMVDAQRLRQILDNLLSNANKHTRQGNIELNCGSGPARAEGSIRLSFAVKDDGEGIPERDERRIFEPFFQGAHGSGVAAAPRSGVGLGLSIARDLARLMGAEIQVQSATGVGSVFSFSIECDLAPEAEAADYEPPRVAALPAAAQRARLGLRILAAEDDPVALHSLVVTLESLGCGVDAVDRGSAAMAMLRDRPDDWDAVITDQMMEGGSGWEVLRFAREHCPALPVILVSGLDPQRPEGFASDAMFDAALRKPVEPLQLGNVLSRVPVAARSLRRPDDPRMATLVDLVRRGEVSAIDAWCDELESQAPECAAYVAQVRGASRRLDFPKLGELTATSVAR